MRSILVLRDLFHGSQDPSVDLFYEICKVVDEDPQPEVILYAQDHLNTWEDQELRQSRVLGDKPSFVLVRFLSLWGNRIGSQGAAALAASPYLKNLTVLDLRWNRIGDAGVAALAATPHLKNLTHLDLWGNRIGEVGRAAIAASPYLKDAEVVF